MHKNRVAVLIDGGFFLKRLRYQFPNSDHTDPRAIARLIHGHAIRHRNQKTGRDEYNKPIFESFDLYRIFYYDCPPFSKKMHHPITKRSIDFSKSPQALFRNSLHDELRKKRKVALRLGHLMDTSSWRLRPAVLSALVRGEKGFEQVVDDDFDLDTLQKGVDMRLGLDVAALTYKRLVDQIVLITGDSDFVPAAKLARREGIDVILDPLGQAVHAHLHEHTDGVRTPEPPPSRNRKPSNQKPQEPNVAPFEGDEDV
ncbi:MULTISPECIES: NYN domain-containing protein [unclassified Chelatococcus]|uniref:NYN domain-containing protein n=1 Tax=unclassified Chelatococcus TaxID=2638111 RepID=UPI001BCC7346|nr:NYN domain-containing protein [Chelatococcus sp.]MBS7741527.1 NYN domain-containing protein [Chelatococcus sp. HY11]CAH1663099.1 NYN domain-containing protein [Hyphomicrobiales bacterium]MBX3544454.1 NYN domain-containing protein [Chelatococcus sp.]MCO5079023.1 NYN domain-containing protein [Chelatococcus sp.]CAH1682391.1 NYN domain-containing protein [Hyphomicrobiales bacterium]